MGRLNAIALPPQSYNQGPLTCGPSICNPPATWRPTRASAWTAWTHVASCHVSAPCAPPAPRMGHPRPCHVASAPRRIRAVVPRATSTPCLVSSFAPRQPPRDLWNKIKKTPLFFAIFMGKINLKINLKIR